MQGERPKQWHLAALGAVVIVSTAGCVGRTAAVLLGDEPSDTVPLFFVTGRVGTTELTVRAADATGNTRVLAEVDVGAHTKARIQATDGEDTFFAAPNEELDPSPDGTAALLVFQNLAVIVESTGESWRLPAAMGPAWSPDGKKVSFFATDGSMQVADRATRAISRVHERDSGRCAAPFVFSPDSKHIAYISRPNADCTAPGELRLMDSEGRDDHVLHGNAEFCATTGFAGTVERTWSADGAYLAFIEPPSVGATGELSGGVTFHIVRADGTGAGAKMERAASDYDATVLDLRPSHARLNRPAVCAWGPREPRLAISAMDVEIVSADGRSLKTFDTTSQVDESLADRWHSIEWAPDGKHLTRITQHQDRSILLTAGVEDRSVYGADLGPSPMSWVPFGWDASGRYLLHAPGYGIGFDLTLYDAETGAEEVLAINQTQFGFNVSGGRIFYESYNDGGPAFAFVRSVLGGRTRWQPGGTRGWLSDDAMVVRRQGEVLARTVDGVQESILWADTAEERLLQLRLRTPVL